VTAADPRDERSGTDADRAPADGPTPPELADEGDATPEPDEPDWVRRRRLDAVFGGGEHGQPLGDRWYRDQVPPHHG
jgi:hypothetical protein